ncbi:MAG: polysaccharide biosynthesis tyrosine autokinase [Verrucomicrobia bacterium]|nr:polysaccharide biosynthesis tyrosine autokinase [Verrucomicrobiota bacterium]
MEAPKTPNTSEAKLHFLDYWRIIRIRKTVILAVFLLVVLTTTAVTFILPESFSSTVRIEVNKDTTDIAPLLLGVPTQNTFDPYFIQTEFEKIKSKTVLYQVITNLALTNVISKALNTEGILRVSEVYPFLLRQIDVRQSRNTSLIEIRVYDEDKNLAAAIANEIAAVYRKTREERSGRASEESIAELAKQLALQEVALTNAQNTMDDLRKQLGVADIDAGGGLLTVEPEIVRMVSRDRVGAQSLYAQFKTLFDELSSLPKEELRRVIPTASPDPQLSDLLSKHAQAEVEYASIFKELGDKHSRVVSLNAIITNLNGQIDARCQGILKGLATQAAVHAARIEALDKEELRARTKDADQMEKYRPYFQAKRNVDTQQRIYETIKLRILQETVDKALPKKSIVQVIDKAEASLRPVRPNIPLNIALGVIVGLLMGFGLAFFIEYLDTSVKTIDDVERAVQAPVLGVIPQNVGALIEEGPESPHAEAYRVLRTNIMFARKESNWNCLTVVSGGAGEGKSTTIFNLATVFAQNGQRVLMVDSDLRRPSLHKLLNVSNSAGLTNFLLNQVGLEQVIQTTSLPTLHFLPSGKLPSSSLGVLNSPQMKEFITAVKARYDFVFFDSPPIMGVSDASILASVVDMSLLVIQYRKYPQAMTIRAKQMVEKVGGNLLGVVLNNINISQDSYYYYYSGYYYDYYSKHDDSESSPKKNGEAKTPASDRGGLEIKQKY